jgi:hypothetical protein
MIANDYKEIIQNYLDGLLSAEEFSKQFDSMFLSEKKDMDTELFEILEDLFEDVMAYDPLCKPEDEKVYMITGNSLRLEAIDAINKLLKYLEKK